MSLSRPVEGGDCDEGILRGRPLFFSGGSVTRSAPILSQSSSSGTFKVDPLNKNLKILVDSIPLREMPPRGREPLILDGRSDLRQRRENGGDHIIRIEPDPPSRNAENSGAAPLPDNVMIEMQPRGVPATILYPNEIWKTLLAVVILLLSMVGTTIILVVTNEYLPSYKPLPDFILDHLPHLEWGLIVSEYCIITVMAVNIIVIVSHEHRWIVARREFLIIAILYIFRCVTMFITVLPPPSETFNCIPPSGNLSFYDVWSRAIPLQKKLGFSMNTEKMYCGDYIFSGHTSILLIINLFIKEYSPRNYKYLHYISNCVTVLGIGMLLLARGHYAIDVIIAWYITTTTFYIYHELANKSTMREGEMCYLKSLWVHRIFLFWEKNVAGPLPRTYSIPWPLCILNETCRRKFSVRATNGVAARP
ncbi:unnamed protein product [Orchesella dallaii]|uniref:Sphingomyelin synthase-like domain-containing protein n=1 Tax=Orchesella dallaii TaxID=48710 RepID=A0ABP1PWX8_9HEXA